MSNRINKGLFTSKSCEWTTSQALFNELSKDFGPFDLDPCASKENAKCEKFYTIFDDGLQQDWTGKVFLNPPYGRTIHLWVRKAYESSQQGAFVVCVLPARTDTRWFHDYCLKGEIRFLRGRQHFGEGRGTAPFPTMIVIFRPAIPPQGSY